MLTNLNLTLILILVSSLSWSSEKLRVVATTQDLAALTSAVSGDLTEIISIGKGTQDPHQIEAKPSFMVKMRTADLILVQGLELESAWLESLVDGSRNPKIRKNTLGYLELAPKLDPIEIPHGKISRAQGDIHSGGNPHFQLDPIRMGNAAILIAERLGELDPPNKQSYLKNANFLKKRLEEKTRNWKTRLDQTGIKEVVTYHKTFAYFLNRFEIKNRYFVEPKPGIPPTTKHLQDLIGQMRQEKIRLVLIENYFNQDAVKKIQSQLPETVGALVPVSVGGAIKINTTEDLIEELVKTFETAKK